MDIYVKEGKCVCIRGGKRVKLCVCVCVGGGGGGMEGARKGGSWCSKHEAQAQL